jgi:hypothetical protein
VACGSVRGFQRAASLSQSHANPAACRRSSTWARRYTGYSPHGAAPPLGWQPSLLVDEGLQPLQSDQGSHETETA